MGFTITLNQQGAMMAPGLDKEETKAALKEAIKEWIDAKYLEFGKWSFRFFATAAFVALIYFIIRFNGFETTKLH